MEGKRSKYDTDPLDPEFERRTRVIEGGPGATREVAGATSEQARRGEGSEDPTRRLEERLPTSYPSVFVPPTYQPPANFAGPGPAAPLQTAAPQAPQPPPPPPPFAGARQRPTSRPVSKLGVPEKFALVLPYAPFYIGLVAAIVELLIVPRDEVRVRFHAAQGLALQLAILAVNFLFTMVGVFGGGRFGGALFSLATLIFLIVSMVRVWKGKPHHIAPLSDASRWINQQLDPRA